MATSLSLIDFAYRAARDLGCLRAGQTLSTDLLNDIMGAANSLLDSWLIDELQIPASPAQVFNLVAGTYIYTIGPNETAPNFTGERPTEIEDANIILSTVTPVLRTPLELINVDQWADIPVQDIGNTLPTRLYYEKSFDATTGASRIMIWGAPLYAYQLELFTWDQSVLREFTDLTTARIYPPGYRRMIQKCLAVEIAPLMAMYSKLARSESPLAPSMEILAMVKQQAIEARETVESYNAPDPVLMGDPAYCGNSQRPVFNYLLGTNGRTGR